jgi:regulator of sigma E protease
LANLIQALPVFLLVLGAMIFVHELGHFLVAKWLGIRVEVFSLGFGTRLFGFKYGDTDYRLSLLPLGGYVKMAGDNIAEEREGAPDEFLSHSKWHRFLVAVAGPVMNLLTAFAIPLVASMIFFEVPAYKVEPPVVATTRAESPAAAAGLEKGDRIVRFDGTDVPTWRDLDDQVLLHPGAEVQLTVERNGQPTTIPVTLESVNFGGERIGWLGAFPDYPGASIVVKQVNPGSAAEAAGMREGDEIVAVNGKAIGVDTAGLVGTINASAGTPLALQVRRDGQLVDLQATPAAEQDGEKTVGRLGFQPALENIPMLTTPLGFTDAVAYSWDTNMRFLRLTGAAFGQIFRGARSLGSSLTGPIGIAEIVGQAAQQGIGPVFELMGLLSLNLGIFNLLPIPVLDGGLILMLALEALLGFFGLQLSMGAKEKMINVGLILIVLLMGFVIFNDIKKHIIGSPSDEPPARSQPAQQPAPQVPAVPVK